MCVNLAKILQKYSELVKEVKQLWRCRNGDAPVVEVNNNFETGAQKSFIGNEVRLAEERALQFSEYLSPG